MSWQRNLDKQTKSVVLQEAATQQQTAARKPVVDPLITERIAYINNRAPWIPANSQLSLAKNYASDQAVDKAAELYSRNLNDDPSSAGQLTSKAQQYLLSGKVNDAVKAVAEGKPVDKNFFEESVDTLYGATKGVIRVAGAIGAAAPELVQNVASFINPFAERSYQVKDSLESFSLFQLLNNWDDQGSGFFIKEELQAQQSEAARKVRGLVNGSAFTIGRGAASVLQLPENSIWYTGVSGFLDFMVQLAVPDPTKYLVKGGKLLTVTAKNLPEATTALGAGKGIKEIVEFAQGVVPSLTKADAKTYREALLAEAGLGRSLTGLSLDVQKWDRFMSSNKTAVKAVQEIAAESDELEIAKKFNWRLSPDQVQKLAAANTVDKVKAELVGPYAIGASTLSTKITDIQTTFTANPGKWVTELKPLRNSRLLSQLPAKQIIINGDDSDRIAAVKNMYLSLKTAGATPETLSKFTKDALKKFRSTSTSDDQRDAYKLYENFLRETLTLNNVKTEVIDSLFERARRNREQLRMYMVDRMGQETDGGFMKVYGDMLKKNFPESVWNEFIEKSAELGEAKMGFARPMQLSQLFDRVQSLPDPRELRRLTLNPFFRETLETAFKTLKANDLDSEKKYARKLTPFTSRRRAVDVEEIIDEARYKEVSNKLAQLPKTKIKDPEVESTKKALQQELNSLTKVTTKRLRTGEQSVPIAILDGLQNAIWKPLTLATIGYIVRNAMDAQLRMAIGGKTGISHPGEYISLLLGETKSSNRLLKLAKQYDISTRERSILGEELTVRGPRLFGKDKTAENAAIREEWARLREEHAELLQLNMRRQGLNEIKGAQHLRATGDWRSVTKMDGNRVYAEAVLDTLRLINEDDIQKAAAQGMIFNLPEEQLINNMVVIADSGKNFRQINGIYERGVSFKSLEGEQVVGPGRSLTGLSPEARKEWLTEHVKNISYSNVKSSTGNLREVVFIAAFDRVPLGDKVVLKVNDVVRKFPNEDLKLGTFVKLKDDAEGIVVSLDDTEAMVQPIIKGSATGKETYKYNREAIKLINNADVDIDGIGKGLNPSYAKEIKTTTNEGKNWFQSAQEGLDKFTNLFFEELYGGKFVKTLERSPVFRKFYYEEISNQIGRLATSEAQILIGKLEKSAKNAGFGNDIGKYIGSQKVATKLKKIASTPGNGTLKASDLDDYARLVGVNKTKDLLYDASEKNNLEDVLRIIFPFVGAWREVAGRYASFMLEDLSRASRAARYSNLLHTSDPDGDGRGFWYEDPQTGDNYFKFPEIFGLPAALRAAGVKSFFEAPVQQLSQGMSWIPGLGPLAQIPASVIWKNSPDTSQIVQTLLPYGKTSFGLEGIASQINPLPRTATNLAGLLYSVIQPQDFEKNKTFGNSLKDVLRANYASGNYDFSTPEGFKKLEEDSIRDARTISIIRTLQQFVGPTSPQVGFQIKVQDKDIYVDEMVKIFSKMQEEDYDTAVPRFLNVFGDEAALYIGSKSESLVPGFEATPEFGNWELNNRDLINDYKSVAAYFAPPGSEFNFDVYRRQEEEGSRRKLSTKEMVTLAQNRIGSAKLRAARKMFGAFPSKAERDRLAAYRLKLHQEYPGFPAVAQFTVGEFENQLIDLREIIKDPRLANNEIVPYVKRYLASRDSLLAQEGLKGFDSVAAQPLAESLYSFGNQLAKENLAFDRIWQRLLSSEVEK